MTDITKNDRALQIMRILMDEYINDGQPVSSRALANNSELSLSAASIRVILAELEQRGYLCSPHTSAGRVPTTQGYRLFVDSLLTVKPLADHTLSILKQHLKQPLNQAELLTRSSHLLAKLTQFVGIATLPQQTSSILKHIEFLALSEQRILVILVFNDHDVYNRIIRTERDIPAHELQQMSNYLCEQYVNHHFNTIKQQLLDELQQDRYKLDQLMQTATQLAEQSLNGFSQTSTEEDCIVVGESNLLNYISDANVETLRTLFNAFQQKRELLSVLDACSKAHDIQIFIGEESGYQHLQGYSLITAPYKIEDEQTGVLGIIGPVRMAYDAIIPTVDITAKLLTLALNE